jgi:hypothetical protein
MEEASSFPGGLAGESWVQVVAGESTVRVKDWVALGESPLAAVMVMGKVPLCVASPDNDAVPLRLSVKVTPAGSGPDSVMAGDGAPVVVTVKESETPCVNESELELKMAGGTGMYVNWSWGLVADLPLAEATVTSTVPVPAGEMAVIESSELTVKLVAGVGPKSTAAAPVKLEPPTVTRVPPPSDPPVGSSDVTEGQPDPPVTTSRVAEAVMAPGAGVVFGCVSVTVWFPLTPHGTTNPPPSAGGCKVLPLYVAALTETVDTPE